MRNFSRFLLSSVSDTYHNFEDTLFYNIRSKVIQDCMADIRKTKKLVKSGNSFFHEGDYDKAISCYVKAVKNCENKSDNKSRLVLADAYNGMGHTLRSKGQFTKSYAFQLKALNLYKNLAKTNKMLDKQMILALHYTADVLADLNHIDKALALSKKELVIARKLQSKNRRSLPYLIYGLNGTSCRLADKKRFKAAVSLLNESLKAQTRDAKSNNFKGRGIEKGYPNLSWTYHILGATQLKMGDPEKAIPNLKKALEIRLTIANKNKRYIGALRNTLDALSSAYARRNTTAAKSKRGIL